MFPIEITVSGPGAAFQVELDMMVELFQSKGYSVKVNNDWPVEVHPHKRQRPVEELLPIIITANHKPWGG